MIQKTLLVSLIAITLTACENNTHMNVSSTVNTQEINQVNSDNNKENVTITTISENISSSSNAIATGKGSIVIDNGKAFLDGKELDIDVSKGSNVVYNNGTITINGQTPKFKNDVNDSNSINIKLTGKQVKIPVTNISTIYSTFKIEQKCSDDNQNYLLIDEAVQPYLSQDSTNGHFHLKNGNYNIQGNLIVTLITKPLESISSESVSEVTLKCINKEKFSLNHSGVGSVNIKTQNNKIIEIEKSGVGEVTLEGTHIDKLIAKNSGVGDINVKLNIGEAHIENNGVGTIDLGQVESLDAVNNGVGTISVEKAKKIIQIKNKGVGNIDID